MRTWFTAMSLVAGFLKYVHSVTSELCGTVTGPTTICIPRFGFFTALWVVSGVSRSARAPEHSTCAANATITTKDFRTARNVSKRGSSWLDGFGAENGVLVCDVVA